MPKKSQERTLRYLETLRDLQYNEQLRFFYPNGAQRRYIDAISDPEAFIVVFSAGNGVGKTACTVALVAAIIWPDIAPKEVFGHWMYQGWPFPKDFRIISTPQEIGTGGSIQREIAKWFPRGQYKAQKDGKNFNSLYTANGFTVRLMSYDQDPQAFEGSTNGLVIYNEPPPEAIHAACTARMRKGGRILFPMTPLMNAAWIMDKIVAKASDSKYIQCIGGDIEANCIEHGEEGMLEHKDIERLLANYDPEELEARKSGKFMHLSGAIYKAFDRQHHVIEPQRPPQGSAVYQIVDPAAGKPFAVIYAYILGNKSIVIFDELPNYNFSDSKDPGMTVEDYGQAFKEKEYDFKVQTRVMDRRYGNATHKPGEPTLKEDFDAIGYEFEDSYQVDQGVEVETGISKVRSFLRWDKTKKMDVLNMPRLFVTANCKNTILAFERWSRDPKTSKPKDDSYKDFADVVRYLVSADPEIYDDGDWNVNVRQPHFGVGNK